MAGNDMIDTNVGMGMVPCRKNCRCLECENQRLQKRLDELVDAVRALPVDEWVDIDRGEPYLVGYVMQAQGEWDRVLKALEVKT